MSKKKDKFTKIEAINNIAQKLERDSNSKSLRKDQIKDIVDLFLEEVKDSLKAEKTVEFRGFGTFALKERGAKDKARNPKTGELVKVKKHKVVSFRPGKELKESVWDV